MRSVLVFVLVGLIFMAAGPSTAKAEFGVVVNPCMYTPDKCIAACKKILKEKFLSAASHKWRVYFVLAEN